MEDLVLFAYVGWKCNITKNFLAALYNKRKKLNRNLFNAFPRENLTKQTGT